MLKFCHLLVFASLLDVATSVCDDSSLSIYVTDEGNIRARFTTTEMVSDDGIIHTMCGLKCGCFENIFLCCSEADCIHMDHECSVGSHGSYAPPIPISAVGRSFVANPTNSVLIQEQPEVDFDHLQVIDDSGFESGILQQQPQLIPQHAIVQIPPQEIQDFESGRIQPRPQLVQESDTIQLQPQVLPQLEHQEALVQLPPQIIQDAGSQLNPQMGQDSNNIHLQPQILPESEHKPAIIQLPPQAIPDANDHPLPSEVVNNQAHVVLHDNQEGHESEHKPAIIHLPPQAIPDANDRPLPAEVVNNQAHEHLEQQPHLVKRRSINLVDLLLRNRKNRAKRDVKYMEDAYTTAEPTTAEEDKEKQNSLSAKNRSIRVKDKMLKNNSNRGKRDVQYMEDAYTTEEATTPQEQEEEQNSHSVKKRSIKLKYKMLKNRMNRAKRDVVYMEDAFTTEQQDEDGDEDDSKRKKRHAVGMMILTTEMETTEYPEEHVQITETPVTTVTSYMK